MKYTPASQYQLRPAAQSRPRHRAGDPEQLTERQRTMYAYIRARIQADGYAPAIREMVEDLHISSTSVVAYNLRALERAGLIELTPTISRGIKLLGDSAPAAAPTITPTITTPAGHQLLVRGVATLPPDRYRALAQAVDQLVDQVLGVDA